MIRSVSIQNFEAHEDTRIEFGEGMNSIVGLSNSGKSAIIRALMVVVNNDWDKDMVRTGYEFCRVKVETERGWVEAERGEKVNRWRCKEGDEEIQSFQKVGTSVPDLATRILGMGSRDRGNGISELPNFQTQLEKHYMLAEVGDKKATSNMIAVMMDNAIGLGGMEDLIKDFSADLLRDRKWLNEKQSEIVDLKSSILDEAIFSQYERDVERIGELGDSVGSMDSDISTAEGYLSRFSECRDGLEDAERRSASIPDASAMEGFADEIGSLGEGLDAVQGALQLSESLATARLASSVDADGMLDACGRYSLLCRMIDACATVVSEQRRLAAAEEVAKIDSDGILTAESEVGRMDSRISKAEALLSGARELWKGKDSAERESRSLGAELGRAEQELDRLKDELGVCPLCGGKL